MIRFGLEIQGVGQEFIPVRFLQSGKPHSILEGGVKYDIYVKASPEFNLSAAEVRAVFVYLRQFSKIGKPSLVRGFFDAERLWNILASGSSNAYGALEALTYAGVRLSRQFGKPVRVSWQAGL